MGQAGDSTNDASITLEMIDAGMTAFRGFDPNLDEPEALIFAILSRAAAVSREASHALRGAARPPS